MASGDSLVVFTATQGEPPDDNQAGFTRILVAMATGEPDDLVPVWTFDDTATEYMEFSGVMPRHYGDGGSPTGVTVTIYWSAVAATGNVEWEVAFKSFTDDIDDLDTKEWATANTTGGVAVPSADGEIAEDTITFTDGADMDSVAAGEYFRLRINRDPATASDLVGDAELIAIEIQET